MRRTLTIITVAAAALGCAGVANATATWTLQAIANPPGVSFGGLFGVSCTTATSCTAVGRGSAAPLAEYWNGSSWTQQATAAPSGAENGVLYGVSCTSQASCTAVGVSTGTGPSAGPLAETWDGSTWALLAPAVPSGEGSSQLTAVSCTSATSCTAVGFSLSTSDTTTQTLAEYWNGSTWTVQPTPNPSTSSNQLLGVSCTSVNRCTAVGYDRRSRGSAAPLAERWDGTKWSLQPASPGSVSGELEAVSCASASTCTAVGGTTGSANDSTLADYWNGSTWTVQPTPGTSGSSFNNLWGVSCPTKTNCTAVGYYVNGSGASITKADHWNGTVWAPQTTAAPKAGKDLNGVSCPSAGDCTAIGYFLNVARQTPEALAEQN